MGLASPNPNRIFFKKVCGVVHLPDGAPESWTTQCQQLTTVITDLELFTLLQT